MLYRSIGKTGGETLFVTIPAEIVHALKLKKADVVKIVRVPDGFRVVVDTVVNEGPGYEVDR